MWLVEQLLFIQVGQYKSDTAIDATNPALRTVRQAASILNHALNIGLKESSLNRPAKTINECAVFN
jgi:hypothetical protein